MLSGGWRRSSLPLEAINVVFFLLVIVPPLISGFVPPTHQERQQHHHQFHPTHQQRHRQNDFIVNPLPTQKDAKFSSFALFGIKGLRAWFDSQFPEAIVSINTSPPSSSKKNKKGKSPSSSPSTSPNSSQQDTFDHVLIDMNQILHVTLRRSRSDEGLSVRMLMSELDRILAVVTPRKSLVLAIDGPPAAAKLATQRRRRFSTLVRTEWKLQHFDKLRVSKRERAKRLRGYNSELESLQITPATDFMKTMEATLLYWSWQRLQQKHSKFNRVRFYISPSNVAGEGEVKLLEWVLQQRNIRGESVAILGRDSDLLLEGLMLPPYYTTHNIFVIRQETSNHYLCVSLWETTRALQRWLPEGSPPNQILQLRTDLVLLLMLNGNDYLPKLRGSNGFSRVCNYYRKLQAEYGTSSGILDPDSLVFNLDFSIDFFQKIADSTPDAWESSDAASDQKTPLSDLNNIIDGGFLPRPARFQVIDLENRHNDDDEEGDDDDSVNNVESTGDHADDDDWDDSEDTVEEGDGDEEEDEDDDEDDEEEEKELVRLTLGKPGSDDCLRYEYWRDPGETFKSVKQNLASMALSDFLGTEYAEERDEFDAESSITTSGYTWEITHAVEGDVKTYLGGLLWNVQTYQDGICADYSYNYGRRKSPSANDIVEFFQRAKAENRTVGRMELLGNQFSKPVSAGLSCLAALPSQVKHLVPAPYGSLPEELVEECYATCMDKEDNSFDLKLFEKLIHNEIREARWNGDDIPDPRQDEDDMYYENNGFHGRRIILGDHYWTVIGKSRDRVTHPFDPPAPPLDSFSALRWNDHIRASRLFSLEHPESRAVWGYPTFGQKQKKYFRRRKRSRQEEMRHSDLGGFLGQGKESILDVPYQRGFQKGRKGWKAQNNNDDQSKTPNNNNDRPKKTETNNKIAQPGKERSSSSSDALMMGVVLNRDDQPAFACLKQLQDVGLVGEIEFTVTPVSGNRDIGNFHPEETRLVVKAGGKSNILKNDLLYDRNRDASIQPKQAFKHHLASLALHDMVGPQQRWSDMSSADLRTYLMKMAKKSGRKR